MNAYLTLDTPLGHAGMAWSDEGFIRLTLPTSREAVEHELGALAIPASEVPLWVQQASDQLSHFYQGAHADLASVKLDMRALPPFSRAVLEAARSIPRGEVVTYGQLAAAVGRPLAARAVGQVLGRNPFPPVVPCHRIVAAGGKPGGFSAPGGLAIKAALLALEGLDLGTLPR